MSEGSPDFDLRRLLTETLVGELTLTVVPHLTPQQSLEEAAAQMREVSHGSALICEAGRLVGIITERDLMRLVGEEADLSQPLAKLMTADPHTLTAGDSLLDAVRLMDQGGYRRLPVVDGDQKPTGLVDVKTVMNFIVDQVPATVYNQASQELLTARRAEGA